MSTEKAGKIYKIKDEIQVVASNFRKREIIIESGDEYVNHNKFEFQQDKVSLLDNFKEGDRVKVSYNLRGRLWNDSNNEEQCFNTLVAWKIELTGKSNTKPKVEDTTEEEMFPPVDENRARGITTAPSAGATDDLPF